MPNTITIDLQKLHLGSPQYILGQIQQRMCCMAFRMIIQALSCIIQAINNYVPWKFVALPKCASAPKRLRTTDP